MENTVSSTSNVEVEELKDFHDENKEKPKPQYIKSLLNSKITFEDLTKLDKFGAFIEFMSVKEAKEKRLIPEPFWNEFDDNCRCGSERMISNTRATITCCNPKCPIKMGITLSKIFSNFGCKNIGKETAITFMEFMKDRNKYGTFTEYLALPSEEFPIGLIDSKEYDWYTGIERMVNTPLDFSELMSLLAIPTYGTKSDSIFKGISCCEDLKQTIMQSGSIRNFLASRGVYDPKRAFYLYYFFKDIFVAQSIFGKNMKAPALLDIGVCITGRLRFAGGCSKKEFINYCNTLATLSNGVQLFNVRMSDAKKSVPYIIGDYPSNTSKYIEGVERGVLITSFDFVNNLKKYIKDTADKMGVELRPEQMLDENNE